MFGIGFFANGVRAAAGGSYELIETITVGSGGASSVTFSNLNAYSTTYQHLQVRIVANSTQSGSVGSYTLLRMNGVSTSSYSRHVMFGSGSSVSSAASTSQNRITFQTLPGTSLANQFSAAVVDILDPYEAKNKTIRALVGISSEIALASGAYLSTDSLTSITIAPEAGSFGQYSRFSIYGLKAS